MASPVTVVELSVLGCKVSMRTSSTASVTAGVRIDALGVFRLAGADNSKIRLVLKAVKKDPVLNGLYDINSNRVWMSVDEFNVNYERLQAISYDKLLIEDKAFWIAMVASLVAHDLTSPNVSLPRLLSAVNTHIQERVSERQTANNRVTQYAGMPLETLGVHSADIGTLPYTLREITETAFETLRFAAQERNLEMYVNQDMGVTVKPRVQGEQNMGMRGRSILDCDEGNIQDRCCFSSRTLGSIVADALLAPKKSPYLKPCDDLLRDLTPRARVQLWYEELAVSYARHMAYSKLFTGIAEEIRSAGAASSAGHGRVVEGVRKRVTAATQSDKDYVAAMIAAKGLEFDLRDGLWRAASPAVEYKACCERVAASEKRFWDELPVVMVECSVDEHLQNMVSTKWRCRFETAFMNFPMVQWYADCLADGVARAEFLLKAFELTERGQHAKRVAWWTDRACFEKKTKQRGFAAFDVRLPDPLGLSG